MDEFDILMHEGTSLASGRYPKGSGEDPYQHNDQSFLSRVKQYKDLGMGEKEIANAFSMSIANYRAKYSAEANALKRHNIELVQKLREKGMSPTAIAERTGIARTTVIGYLKEPAARKATILRNTADALKAEVDAGHFVNVSGGNETCLGVSETRLKNAVKLLKEEGYTVEKIEIKEIFTNNTRTFTVLAPPDTTKREIWDNRFDVRPPGYFTEDGGETFKAPPKRKDIVNVDSKRIKINYAEDGGSDKDGVIELRRGVDDLSLGGAHYAQVRIGVDGTHYLKGMAVYADDLPEGIDIRFNTNKHKGTPMCGEDDRHSVLKLQKDNPDNPFGAEIKLVTARGYGGAINIVNEEGDWDKWTKSLASQFLSKQPPSIAKRQLQLAYMDSLDEFNDIQSLTNPTIKKQLLKEFGDECDSKAVHLHAAALPRQSTSVILPVTSISEKEIFAPRYENGEEVILVRYPHEGTFQIPRLRVNNKNKEANRVITKQAIDAVGINAKTAAILSGADFDGDNVIVIPTKKLNLVNKEPLAGLKNFDPKESYPGYEGMKIMSKRYRNNCMGRASNLITDMSIKGASNDELERAVRYSMTVIDAHKHGLDWKRAFRENRIAELQDIYQPSADGSKQHSASTLISRAKGQVHVTNRKQQYHYDPETGEKLYTDDPKYKIDFATGKKTESTTKSSQMAEAKDAFSLSSGYEIENVYASYANKMKALGNSARKAYEATEDMKYKPEAKVKYAAEVASLDNKLKIAKENRPRESTAFLIAKQTITNQLKSNPEIRDDNDAYKKMRANAINNARAITGAKKESVKFTDREWEAVQAGAISASKLKELIRNTKSDDLKKLAMPAKGTTIPEYKLQRARNYLKAGHSWSEISERLGYSESALIRALRE